MVWESNRLVTKWTQSSFQVFKNDSSVNFTPWTLSCILWLWLSEFVCNWLLWWKCLKSYILCFLYSVKHCWALMNGCFWCCDWMATLNSLISSSTNSCSCQIITSDCKYYLFSSSFKATLSRCSDCFCQSSFMSMLLVVWFFGFFYIAINCYIFVFL